MGGKSFWADGLALCKGLEENSENPGVAGEQGSRGETGDRRGWRRGSVFNEEIGVGVAGKRRIWCGMRGRAGLGCEAIGLRFPWASSGSYGSVQAPAPGGATLHPPEIS